MYSTKASLPSLGRDEHILSIVLSSTELAELDLSKLQLFQTSAVGNPSSNDYKPVVYKTRGAIEAEKSVEENKKKETSMDRTEHDPRPLAMQNIRRKSKQDPPAGLEPKAEETGKVGIDLKSSPASKFLVPWELQPSPMTPFTPAAVPFEWEEAPGKPKKRAPDMVDRRSQKPQVLHLPPRLLSRRTMLPPSPPKETDASHRRSGSSGSADEKRVICVHPAENHQKELTPGCLVSSLDCQVAYYSPLSALGPPPPEDLHWGAKASALITLWRKKSSVKHKLKHHSNNKDCILKNKSAKSFDPSIDGEERNLWVDGASETRTRAQSLNAVIAVAMGVKTEGYNSCKEITPCSSGEKSLEPIMGSDVYCSNLVDNKRSKRRRRRWVLRKLRRPVRFFKTFFGAVWRAVRLGKSRHRSRGNLRLSYKSLRR